MIKEYDNCNAVSSLTPEVEGQTIAILLPATVLRVIAPGALAAGVVGGGGGFAEPGASP